MNSEALVAKFEYALDNKWGYIWGAAGILWTKDKQKQKVDYMVNKYGTSWKKNAEAKSDNYYNAACIGDKWIGHYVADCSGLFKWAFDQFKTYIAHGSNSIWRQYCTITGTLVNGRRSDGKTLRPGTAIFTDKNGDKTHIGLYIGGSKVIEAASTDAGVCMSNITATKWKCWGELKNVSYDGDSGFPDNTGWRATIRRGSKGQEVRECQTMLSMLGYDLGSYGIDGDYGKCTEAAVKAFQKANNLQVDGVVGPLTWDALEKATAHPASKYKATITGLTKAQADELKAKFPSCTIEGE